MAYSVTIPPVAYVPGIGSYPTIWVYQSADDDATVNGSGYFTDGKSLGMKVNDIVLCVDTATPKVSLLSVSAVSATTGAATTIFGAVS